MFTFTKKADYALLALSYLVNEGRERVVGPREIARHYEIPAELLAKVMQTLSRRQIVASIPGPTGGYRLIRPASEISVAEVLEAVDGPLAIAQCWEDDGPGGCAQAPRCHLRGPLARMQDQITALMRSTTLADVSATSKGPGEAFARRQYEPSRMLNVVAGAAPASRADQETVAAAGTGSATNV